MAATRTEHDLPPAATRIFRAAFLRGSSGALGGAPGSTFEVHFLFIEFIDFTVQIVVFL